MVALASVRFDAMAMASIVMFAAKCPALVVYALRDIDGPLKLTTQKIRWQ